MPYRIDYDPEALRDAAYYGVGVVKRVREACRKQLANEPTKETRNRFRAGPNDLGEYELRVQPYRVYYDVDEAGHRVVVQAVLYKPRETAYRRGQEVSTRE
jgi:mRNA-degrading endonuclease RelE of RelBE toxin-antitoxin system